MSDLKPRGVPITLEGVGERHLLFDLNAIEALQEKYDKGIWEILTEMTKKKMGDTMLCSIVTILLNAESERMSLLYGKEVPEVSERAVGCMIGLDNYSDVLRAVLSAYGISMPKAEEGENPNTTSGQQSS